MSEPAARNRVAAFIVSLCAAGACPAQAASVEFPAWEREFAGTVDGRPVHVTLTRERSRIVGYACPRRCSSDTARNTQLNGTIEGDRIRLDAGPAGDAAITGKKAAPERWILRLQGQRIEGTSGSRRGAIRLDPVLPLPFDMRVVADRPSDEDAECNIPSHVSAIRLYRDGKLVQQLKADSTGGCGVFAPSVVDANFDGLADLSIMLEMPAHPNIVVQTWLFDGKRGRFVDAPAALQAVTSPDYDAEHKTISSSWRGGCCSHGVTTYRWRGTELVEAETAESYAIPVLDGGRKRYCYVVPSYRDGRIVVDNGVEESNGRLSFGVADLAACDVPFGVAPDTRIDVWSPAKNGTPRLLRTEKVHWLPVTTGGATRYCPQVPFFDRGRIVRILLDDDPAVACTDEKP